ncbi:hypothetical protein RHODO2019_18425 (plasmid) [Rhodococcus antarcticus]|uniref:MarR family transcriptional regulator n=1 Tax=Rhodococcus antarcticus TaxID=2987751 RepID=A0ABY6P665_9NOCA|nr:hypothetical protein [Rhodococcus antarcticus]UZJ26856.1 hypothetical protein RHODO2019_18425 [Rhodococcus antarcticus]
MRTTFHGQLDALLAQLFALCRLTEVALARAPRVLLGAFARADGLGLEVLDQL